MSPQKKASRSRGRPADQSPIYVTSLRPKHPDPDLLASALLAHYRNIYGRGPQDGHQHLLGNGHSQQEGGHGGEVSS